MKREVWVERILKGVSFMSGFLAVVGMTYFGLAMLWLAMKAPDAFALVASASIIGAAIAVRKPAVVNNLQLGHPDAENLVAAIQKMLKRMDA